MSNENEFVNVPLLNKEIIREKSYYLINPKVQAQKNTSGGSTGEPIEILQCHNFDNWKYAQKTYNQIKTAKISYPKSLIVWGSERDILEDTRNWSQRLRNYFRMSKIINSFKMTQKDIKDSVNTVNRFKPQIIKAYVQSMYEICKHINQDGETVFCPNGIIVSAGTCYKFMEDEIRKAFPCPLINNYGSREVSDMAASCDGRDFLHINMLTHYIEIVDDDDKPVPAGISGNIVVTSLTNKAMPLIRYKIGDRGIKSPLKKCPRCGWEGDIIENVIGRSVDIFKNVNGDMIDGEFLTHLFYFRDWLKKFQIIQQKTTELKINIVLADNLSAIPESEKNEIFKSINKVFPRCHIDWQIVDDIVYDKSGKIRYTISQLYIN
jgi:phenylacetate-CoA ligase